MAAKTDGKTTPAVPEKAAEAPAAAPAPAGAALRQWLPAIAAVVVTPALTFAVAQFVLLPRLEKRLTAAASAPASAAGEAAHAEEPAPEPESSGHGGGHGGGGKAAPGSANYEFANVVVNLAGTMGTRYLKTSFVVTGVQKAATKPLFEANKDKLTDITLSVLSSLTLADLEEPGSKNVLRDKLVSAYNQALGKRIVDQVYFSDFVVQ